MSHHIMHKLLLILCMLLLWSKKTVDAFHASPGGGAASSSSLSSSSSPPETTIQQHSSSSSSLDCYIGLDVGTQGTKCLVYCPTQEEGHGGVIARSSVSYGLEETTIQGRAEQDPHVWLEAVETCFRDVGNQIKNKNNEKATNAKEDTTIYNYKISGIGVSGQQHGMVALDSSLQPVRYAKLWCDVEASAETQELREMAMAKAGIDRTFLTPGFTSPKILWLKKNEPENFDRTCWFVLPHDYITMKLGSLSAPITDSGDASGNGLFDMKTTRQNIPKLANLIDPSLHEKLPKVLGPNGIAGYLNDHYKQLLGLSSDDDDDDDDSRRRNNIPISVGSGDNMCSALGVGCVVPGQAVMSLGTSGTLFGVSQTPVPTNTPLAPFCDATGQHLPLACTMSCTGVLTQVLQECCPEGWTHNMVCERLQSNSTEIGIGCNGVTFLPFLGGERTPNWPHATGALLGLTAQSLNRETLGLTWYRAGMEAITFCLADTLQYFPDPTPLEKLYVVGGGAKNKFWRQMIADVMQCQLVFPVEPESAALGAAFQAGAAAEGIPVKDYVSKQNIPMEPETVEPIPENADPYKEAFDRYRTLGNALYA